MNIIDVQDIRKSYSKVEVLRGINLQVKQGSLIALLGPNGAGKTTIIRILATLLRFDSGTARIFGHDVVKEAEAVRRRISLTGQFASVDDELTGTENLVLIARLLGYTWSNARNRADELIQSFDLEKAAKQQVKRYSGGMRRRLDIAASIIVSPDLLFLDEPTTGLDPRSRRYIWNIIRTLRASGTTVMLTTQYLEEADELADRIIILDQGIIIADGTPDQLKASIGSGVLNIRLASFEQQAKAKQIIEQTCGLVMQSDPDTTILSAPISNPEGLAITLTALSQAGIMVTEFAVKQPSLDDVFLSLTEQATTDKTITNREIA